MSEQEYARWLDFLRILLAVQVDDGLNTACRFTAATPFHGESDVESYEKKLYFRWAGGKGRPADIDLLRKAGMT
jgi:hypothetical protein